MQGLQQLFHPPGFFDELVFPDDEQVVALVQKEAVAVGILAALTQNSGLGFWVTDGTAVVVTAVEFDQGTGWVLAERVNCGIYVLHDCMAGPPPAPAVKGGEGHCKDTNVDE